MTTASAQNTAQTAKVLEAAAQRLQLGRPEEARALLAQVLTGPSPSSDALHLYGVSLRQCGDPIGAELPIRQAIAIDKRQPAYHVTLGDVLQQLGWPDKAEASYRAALNLNRLYVPAVRQMTLLLTDMGRAADALKIIAPLVAGAPTTDHGLLNAHAGALKGVGRLDEALAVYRRAVEAAPTSGVAEHNVAALLGDMGRNTEAVAAAQRAFAKGVEAPETRVVQARALIAIGQFDEAETTLRTAVSQRPLYIDAQRDLAQLVWMRTEDKVQATAAIDEAIGRQPGAAPLHQLKAKVLTFAGDIGGADAILRDAVRDHPEDANLLLSAAQAATAAGDPLRGLQNTERALVVAGQRDPYIETFVCEALLALGKAEEAAKLAEDLSTHFPNAQHPLAYLATARRMLGDGRYLNLFDYEAFVRPAIIDTPVGWDTLEAYLADLAAALNAEHRLKTHPLDQSLRMGSQLSNALQFDYPAIKAFPQAVDGPIRAYMAALGRGTDPLRARNTGNYGFQGLWSVKLRSGGGRHVDHIHPEGWLSSACYIELPKAVADESRQGWIKFGEPGVPTLPTLGPEHYVKPEPGLLVLFPSYMWHGTVPFEGDDSRLTIAFDVIPKPL
jgi:tetratricopeptide (TPR) repeat protein